MGWFEELAKGARFSTLGKLARAAVAHEEWPEDESRNDRSVENMLRLVDQKKRKGQVWLDNRPQVKEVLATLLNVSPESLDPGLMDADGPADPRVELKELREARPIDLRRDDLYPGIPDEVLDPSNWGRSWWLANVGAGKTLVGKWLEARGLATFLRGDRLADVIPRIPPKGAVYIELALPDTTDAARWAEELDDRDVCVAAPFLPVPLKEVTEVARQRQAWQDLAEDERDEEEPELAAGWDWIKTPPKDEWVEPLIRWVGDRMREGGGFDVDGALDIVGRKWFATWLATPGDYIGVCGVIEKLGARKFLDGVEVEQVVTAFLESRLERTDLSGRSAWLPKDLWRLISGCVEGALVNSGTEDTFASEQMLKQWLPTDALPEGDDTVLRQLVDVPPSDMEGVEAVLRRARPSTDGAIRELVRLHLLEPIGEGAVALRPTWFALLAAEPAMERLVADPNRGIGRLLLRPKAAKWPLTALRDAFLPDEEDEEATSKPSAGELGWTLVRTAVAGVRVDDPESVALLEALFQAAGIALLDREVPAQIAALRSLWDAQMRLAVRRFTNAPPQPRIFQLDREAKGWESGWYIAALAISERLHDAGEAMELGALAPWGAAALPEFADQALSGLQRACILPLRSTRDGDESADPPDFVVDAWRLAGRLYRRFGPPTNYPHVRLLYAPFVLFDAMKRGDTSAWDGRFAYDYQMEALSELAADEGLTMAAVLDALWRVENVHHQPALLPTDKFSEEWRAKIWAALPPEVLATTLKAWIHQGDGLAWDLLTTAHWDIVLDEWRAESTHDRRGLDHLPEQHARAVIRERLAGFDSHRVYVVLWENYPEVCLDEAIRDLVRPPPDGTPDGTLWKVPAALVERVIELVQPHLAGIRGNPLARAQLMRWAHFQCSSRGPHWLSAWKLLNEVEPADLQRQGVSE